MSLAIDFHSRYAILNLAAQRGGTREKVYVMADAMALAAQQIEKLKPQLAEFANLVNQIDEKLDAASGGDTIKQSQAVENAVSEKGEAVKKSIQNMLKKVLESDGETIAAFWKLMGTELSETVKPKVTEYVAQVNAASATGDETINVDALREERKELMEKYRALHKVFEAWPDINISDIAEPKKRGGGRKKGSLTNKKKGAIFYVNDEKFVSFAQAASAATKDMDNVGRGKDTAPTAYLRAALKAANLPSSQNQPYEKAPWEIQLDNGVTVRAIKVDAEGNEVSGEAETTSEEAVA